MIGWSQWPLADFDSCTGRVDLNDNGMVCVDALVGGSTSTVLLAGYSRTPVRLATYPGIVQLWPQVSNAGTVVIMEPQQQRIIAWPYVQGPPEVFASAASGFLTVGTKPGISKDGNTVAFVGDRGAQGGQGVYLGIKTASQGILHVTMASAQMGGFTGFDANQRAAVVTAGDLVNGLDVTSAFMASRNGKTGVYFGRLRLRLVGQSLVEANRSTDEVVMIGSAIGGTTVKTLELYDPMNEGGDIACFATLNDGTSGVIFARRLSDLTIVDATNLVERSGRQVPADTTVLDAAAKVVAGACADGHTRVVLKFEAPNAGTVRFRFHDAAPLDETGTLQGLVGASWTAPAADVLADVKVLGTRHVAFATYRAPLNFARNVGQDDDLRIRPILVEVCFTPQGGTPGLNGIGRVALHRPPVVLCHGLWSNRETWKNKFRALADNEDARFITHPCDYRNSAHESFSVNAPRVPAAAKAARALTRAAGFACTQVDWVGHSMGGVLPRYWYKLASARGEWEHQENGFSGEIHKMILLNSPQSGAPIANRLYDLRLRSGTIDEVFVAIDCPIGGAVFDLRQNSEAFAYIGKTEIPTHAIIGVGGKLTIGSVRLLRDLPVSTSLLSDALRVARMIGWVTSWIPDAVFRITEHDMLVPEESQRGGIQKVTPMSGFDSIHTEATGSGDYYKEVTRLLNARIEDEFQVLPAPARYSESPPPPVTLPLPSSLMFLQPLPTSSAFPGQSLVVQISGQGGFSPALVQVFVAGSSTRISALPFTGSIAIPATAAGSVRLVAFGVDASGKTGMSTVLELPVQQTATLTGMRTVQPSYELVRPLESRSVTVLGMFSDAVERNVSAPNTGTSYSTSPGGIVTVDAAGVLSTVSQGTTILTVRNGAVSIQVPIEVRFEPTVHYGFPGLGTGGVAPSLDTGGELPTLGNPRFKIAIRGAAGGVLGQLWVSARAQRTPLLGGELLVDPACGVGMSIATSGAPGGVGDGQALVSVPLPADPALGGVTLFWQGLLLDRGAPQWLSHTDGMATTLH